MAISQPQGAPTPSTILFARGVIARLAIWPTLRIAVQEGWGGNGAAEKRTWLAGVIVDNFEEQVPTPDDVYVEELLLQIMVDEFDAVLEDESAEKVAIDIVHLWDSTRAGKADLVLKFEALADGLKGKRLDVKVDEGDEWEDEDEDEEGSTEGEEVPQLLNHASHPPPPKNEPEVDEDGFTMVKGKGKGRK